MDKIKGAAGFERLQQEIAGSVVVPGDPDFDGARRAWNLAVEQRPAAVVFPESADDVSAAVRHAASAGLRVAAQGTGHGAAARGAIEGTLLLNMARMRSVEIGGETRSARVGGGTLWRDVTGPAAEHGLAALHGSAPDAGVVGYTLGGGIGWLARRFGLASNAVTAVELVTADGSQVRADRGTNSDLLWATRGGGGSFGVVTALEFGLFPVESVFAGWLLWPWERANEVLSTWARWVETVPDEVTSIGRILQLPPLPHLPDHLRGRQLVVVEAAILGEAGEAGRLLAPLRALGPELDTFSRLPLTGLAELHMDPPEPVPAVGDGVLLDALPPQAVERFVELTGPGSGSPLLSVELRHLGGALERVPPDAGALASLDGGFALFSVGIAMTPEMAAAAEQSVRNLVEAMGAWGRGRRYLNFAERPVDTMTAFDAETYRRLQSVRAQVDPGDILRANHPIPSSS